MTRSPSSHVVSAVIVNYQSGDALARCVRSLVRQGGRTEILIVDNGSTDGSVAAASKQFRQVRVIATGKNLGFAQGANLGAAQARGDILLFLNPDIELGANCVNELIATLREPGVGVVGPRVATAVSATVEYGAAIDPLGSPRGLEVRAPVFFVPGCALATPARTFAEVGGFDDRYFMFVEDVDYCWRALLRGHDVRVAAAAEVTHVGGASAPGGYPTAMGLQTSIFRVVSRERHTLATLVKCYSGPSLLAVLPLYLAQTVATAGILAATGRHRTACGLLSALLWNLSQLPATLRLRREVQLSRAVGDRDLWERMHHGLHRVSIARQFGLPSVFEHGRGNWD